MKFSLERLEQALSPHGYWLQYVDEVTGGVVFTRGLLHGLFAQIRIDQGWTEGGVRGDLVGISSCCSIVPGRTALKGLAIGQYVELPSDDHSGWTHLGANSDTLAWESSLVEIAPRAASELSERVGSSLLEHTKAARQAAADYFRRVWIYRSVELDLEQLRRRASEAQYAECQRLLGRPIVCIPNGRPSYELATLAIVVHCGEVDANASLTVGRRPDSDLDRRLMVRIQLLASRFSRERGWDEEGGTR